MVREHAFAHPEVRVLVPCCLGRRRRDPRAGQRPSLSPSLPHFLPAFLPPVGARNLAGIATRGRKDLAIRVHF